ncbi:DEAD/DEAH box helicase family protein [Imbroritus primus]|uniref:DEAD/DEAH box helicase family protein n=1 Tax=Imbroritus primus TaxID=3058603 RepID=UPI003D16182E
MLRRAASQHRDGLAGRYRASGHLSPHFFDFIVVDESHRSIYNTFGEVLDYFKAITLGLTATPTDIIDHNTFQLFHCEDGIPTFAYTYEEAVNNVPPSRRNPKAACS